MDDTDGMLASPLGLALALDGGKPPSKYRIYEVDGLLFRVDPTRPTAAAEALREGSWRTFCLTGSDVQALLGARELSPEEAYLAQCPSPNP